MPPSLKPPVLPARVRILEAAMRLFYRDGVRATGIDRIIGEAGVAKMSFYRHFPSKDDLVVASLEERHKRWLAWFEQATTPVRPKGRNLAAVADALAEWFADPEFRGCALINVMAEVASDRERRVAIRRKAEIAAVLARLAEADGVPDPSAAAEVALIAVDGAIVRAQMTGEGEASARALRQLLLLVVAGTPQK